MVKLETAIQIVLNTNFYTEIEIITIENSQGRILAEDIFSKINMPPFRKSMVDGFACKKEDINNFLRIIGEIKAGADIGFQLKNNECVKIMTGAPVPDDADIVVMIEDVDFVSSNVIRVKNTNTSSNISDIGEDIKVGDLLLKKGVLIQPQHAGIIASLGLINIKVFKRPSIGIIVTGDEVIEPGNDLIELKIYNSNAYQLICNCKKLGIEPHYYGIISDKPDIIEKAIAKSITENTITIVTGGVSKGDYDFVAPAIKKSGLITHFDSVAAQPGKPLVFASKENKFIFGMPGNPVSGFVIFENIIKPFIYKLMGHEYRPIIYKAILKNKISRKKADRKSFYPVKLNEDFSVSPIEYHGSAHLNAYIEAFGIVALEEGVLEINQGEYIYVRPI